MKITKNNPKSAMLLCEAAFRCEARVRNPQSKGTATVEFVMAIPLLVFVIAGMFFFGWVMRNHQRLRVADRFGAWQNVDDNAPTAGEIDSTFFSGRGVDTSLETDDGPDLVLEAYIDAAQNESGAAGDLVDDLITGHRVPRGSGMTVKSQFETTFSLWRKMAADPMTSRHVREGRSWRRGQVNIGGTMRELYFDDIESKVNDVAGGSVGQSLQNLLQHGW